jgi:adenylate cyclase
LTAYDLYLQALPHRDSFGTDRILQALDLLGHAIERDPHYGPVLATAAYCHQMLAANDWVDDLETNRRTGIGLARHALQFAPNDPEALAFSGFALGYFGEDINVSIELIERSLALNPSSARGWWCSGVLRNYAGQPVRAIEHFKNSLRLNPRNRISPGPGLGAAHFFGRRFDEAASLLVASLEQAPTFVMTYRLLASCYAHMGRLDEAREVIKRLRGITSVVVPKVIPYRNPEYRELFLSGRAIVLASLESVRWTMAARLIRQPKP